MHFLITGHTGFKGSWLTLLLRNLGHEVSGVSLDPEKKSLFEKAKINRFMLNDERLDIRNFESLKNVIKKINPEVVIHLAAQPLVRVAYENPRFTFETNVLGTLNVLESIKNLSELKATLIITTDKVYKNINQKKSYVESDPLGGDDPYSASKAMADLMTQSFIKSYDVKKIAVARAGNVIGGGDFSKDRLMPDILSGLTEDKEIKIRYPQAVRPWQHVLDCLNGYYALINKIIEFGYKGEWNFGPDLNSFKSVSDVIDCVENNWSSKVKWQIVKNDIWPESELLMLDSTKAIQELGWKNLLNFDEAITWTLEWQRQLISGKPVDRICIDQIENFLARK